MGRGLKLGSSVVGTGLRATRERERRTSVSKDRRGPGPPGPPGRTGSTGAQSLLREGERADDLQRAGLVVIQDPESVRFSTDSVLLAWFAAADSSARPSAAAVQSAVDLGTGTGVIPLLLSARTAASRLVGVEIVPRLADMAARSVLLNGLESRIAIVSGDIRDPELLGRLGRFDLVTCNPPYVAVGAGVPSRDAAQASSDQELAMSLDDACAAAYRLLGPKGRFCVVHRPERMADLFGAMRRHALEPKRMTTVHSHAPSPPAMILVEGLRDAGPGVIFEPPVAVYDEAGRHTPVMDAIYGITGEGRSRPPGVGLLSVCGTPIGNLGDMTLRAIRTLAEADVVAAEETRVCRKLLAHLGISKSIVSYRQDVAERAGERILSLLRKGRHVVLLSAAGMPAVSDPGAELIGAARGAGHRVEVVPGPSAVTAAWAASGLGGKGFVFAGFLPRQPRELDELLRFLGSGRYAFVAYEAPHRIQATMERIAELFPDRWVALCRELTKIHEEVIRGAASEVARQIRDVRPRGEYTLVVAGGPGAAAGEPEACPNLHGSAAQVADKVLKLVEGGVQKKQAIKQVAHELGVPRKEVYALAQGVPPSPSTPKRGEREG